MYRDADEVESFGAEALVPTSRLRALLEHLGITTIPRNRIKDVPCLGQVKFEAIVEIFFGSKILCRHQGQLPEHLATMMWLAPPGRPSLHGSIATSAGYRTPSTASYFTGRRTCSMPMG
jgi:hypothetical protein